MNWFKIEYRENTTSIESILEHLIEVADCFNPVLFTYVAIEKYAKKIINTATTFEAWVELNGLG